MNNLAISSQVLVGRPTIFLVIVATLASFISGFMLARHIYKTNEGHERIALVKLSMTQMAGIGLFVWYSGFTKNPDSIVSMVLLAVGLGGATGELFATVLERYIGSKGGKK